MEWRLPKKNSVPWTRGRSSFEEWASGFSEFGPDDFKKVLNAEVARELAAHFKAMGFKYVTLDLEGYRTGSANEVLDRAETEKFSA